MSSVTVPGVSVIEFAKTTRDTSLPSRERKRTIDGSSRESGLNTSFTKTASNGAAVGVASTERVDGQGQNRELDLDLYPTELFTRLDVSKSPVASQLEGGAAGTCRGAPPYGQGYRPQACGISRIGAPHELQREPIAEARLNAIPWTRSCITCKEKQAQA